MVLATMTLFRINEINGSLKELIKQTYNQLSSITTSDIWSLSLLIFFTGVAFSWVLESISNILTKKVKIKLVEDKKKEEVIDKNDKNVIVEVKKKEEINNTNDSEVVIEKTKSNITDSVNLDLKDGKIIDNPETVMADTQDKLQEK